MKTMFIVSGLLMSFMLVAQEPITESTIRIDEPIISLSNNSHAEYATLFLATNLGITYTYEFTSAKSRSNFLAQVELIREKGRWRNVLGVNPIDMAIYTMHAWELSNGKFPVRMLVCGQYSYFENESLMNMGSQISYEKNKKQICLFRLYLGTPVETFKPAVGLQFIIPFVEQL